MAVTPMPVVNGCSATARLGAAAFPDGIPAIRRRTLERTGPYFTSALDAAADAGDPGLFGPESPTWRIMGSAARPMYGFRAALLQTLAAPIPTATEHTGTFTSDFMGRVTRTAAWAQRVNLGSVPEARTSLRRVRAMHRRVKGVGPDGTPFDATDPHLQSWVSMTFTDSMLAVNERFGPVVLTSAQADRLVLGQSTHAALLDERVDIDAILADPDAIAALRSGTYPLVPIVEGSLPITVDGLRSGMAAYTPHLATTELSRALIARTLRLEMFDGLPRLAMRPFVLATLSTIPDELHDLLAPDQCRNTERVVAAALQGPLGLAQAILGRGQPVEVAIERAARPQVGGARQAMPTSKGAAPRG